MKRPLVIAFLCAIVVAICTLQFCSGPTEYRSLKPDKRLIELAQNKISEIKNSYDTKLALLQFRNNRLNNDLKATEEKLKKTTKKLAQYQTNVLHLAEKDTLGISIKDQLEDCDSLKTQVKEYVHWVDSTHALCSSTIFKLEQIVAIKDSALAVCSTNFEDLRKIAEANVQRERQLTDELETAFKVQKRETLQNKLLAGGLIILSGVLSIILIKGQK